MSNVAMTGFLSTSISALMPESSGGRGFIGEGLEVLTPFPHVGPILLASVALPPGRPQNRQRPRLLQDHKDSLANFLWREWISLAGGGGGPGSPEHQPGDLAVDNLGKPYLRGASQPPAISFSQGGGRLWAALAGAPSGLGLDAATSQEFLGDYPWRRVFHDQELEHSQKYTGGDRPEAAALLWSAKEAAVKSLSCAFHFFGPRHLWVRFAGPWPQGLLWAVTLSGAGIVRGASLRREGVWLSLAVGPT